MALNNKGLAFLLLILGLPLMVLPVSAETIKEQALRNKAEAEARALRQGEPAQSPTRKEAVSTTRKEGPNTKRVVSSSVSVEHDLRSGVKQSTSVGEKPIHVSADAKVDMLRRFRMQGLISGGNAALEDNNPALAEEKFRSALALDSSSPEALEGLRKVTAMQSESSYRQ